MKLVIVESPTKCNTIQRYLGSDYLVKASRGHVRDLSMTGKGGLGVDVEAGFVPTYTINKDKIKVVNELQSLSKAADEVILATDPDREGEAIAWHLAQVLNLDVNQNKRWEFHEITRSSISEASKNPRTIDMNTVSSQETRRILDRIIGFKLSTLLNNKIHSRSAGRVQSATLKLIYDHEKEIKQFVAKEYWTINVKTVIRDKEVEPIYLSYFDENKEINDQKLADEIIAAIGDKLKVSEVKKSIRQVESKLPFTTSTLQQEAFAKLKFNTKRTQSIAQSLYEGINVDGEHVGLITYMRTDSTRLSPSFVARANAFIEENYGKEYLGHQKFAKSSENIQDAHEAIRPTSNHRTPESIRKYLTPDQYNLYKLIYNRALASLMSDKKEEVSTITLSSNGVKFKVEYIHTLFDGFTKIYHLDNDNHAENLPSIYEGEEFPVLEKKTMQKFTQPPAHYTEGKIVKLMEEVGIGRPSTYASTIDTLKKRKYIVDEKGVVTMAEQGEKTIDKLDQFFPEIVNAKYTADMEKKLDSVEEGSQSRIDMLSDFYYPFIKEVEDAKIKMRKEIDKTGDKCPICGSDLVYKIGKNGRFVGCSNYPKCKYVQKEPKKELVYVGRICPQCGKELVERQDKKGNKFVACSGFPTCLYIENNQPPVKVEIDPSKNKKCPDCETGYLIKKKGKYGYFLGCSNYPNCKHMEPFGRKKRS